MTEESSPAPRPSVGRRLWRGLLRAIRSVLRFTWFVVSTMIEVVYKTVTRTALYLVTLYLLIYFVLNSDEGRGVAMGILSQSLPGDFSADVLQWGPLPHEVTLLDAVVRDPLGDPIILAPRASVLVDWRGTQDWLLRKIFVDGTGTEILFSHATVERPRVRIDIDPDGWTGIAHTFSDKTGPDGPKGPPTHVFLGECRVTDATVTVSVAGVDINGAAIDVPNASVLVHGRRVRVAGEVVRSDAGFVRVGRAGPGGGPLMLPWRGMQSHDVVWDTGRLEIGRGRLRMSDSAVSLTGALDTEGETSVDLVATVEVGDDDPLVVDWAEGVGFGGFVSFEAHGPITWPQLRGFVDAERLLVGDVDIGPLVLGLEMTTDPYRRRARFTPFHTEMLGGLTTINELEFRPDVRGRDDGLIVVGLDLDGVRPEALFEWGVFDGEPPGELTGTLSGRVWTEVRLRRDGMGGTGVAGQADLELAYEWDDPAALLPPHTELTGRVRATWIDGEQRVETDGLSVASTTETARVEGQYDAMRQRFDLAANADLSLGDFLERLGVDGWTGRAALDGAWVTGTARDPWVIGRVNLRRGRVAGLDVDRFDGMARLERGTLRLASGRAKTALGTLESEVEIGLWSSDVGHISSTFPLTLTRAQATGLSLADLEISGLTGTASITAPRFELQLGVPGYAPSGKANIRVSGLRVGDETFKSFNASVVANGGSVHLPTVVAVSDSDAELSGKGTWNRRRKTVDVELRAERVDLTRLAALGGVPLRGVVGVEGLEVKGPLDRLGFKGTLKFRKFGYAGVQLGDASIAFERAPGASRVRLTSGKFFDSMRLNRGELKLTPRGLPKTLIAQVAAEGLDILELFPDVSDMLTVARVVKGDVLMELPISGNRPFRVVADLPHEALQVQPGKDSPLISNDGPLWASLVGQSINIERFVVAARGQRLATCGQIKLSGDLDLDVAGSLDLRQVTSVKKLVSDLEGTLTTGGAVAKGDEPFTGSCLMIAIHEETRQGLGRPNGFVRIRNALKAPTLDGAVTFSNVRMIPRGLGREVAIESGVVELRASKGLKGAQELEISPDAPLAGTVDEGTFSLSGRAKLPPVLARTKLEHWLPDSGYLDVSGTDLYWAEPKEYRVVLDPDLRLRFRSLWQPEEKEAARLSRAERRNRGEPTLTLSGKVAVPEGTYFESFTLLARSIGSVLQRREIDGVSTSITDTLPVLRRMTFDNVEVRGENLVVQSDFGVGKTDLDTRFKLNVRGSFEEPRLHGFLEVTDGTLTYAVFRRVFEVNRGRLDFDGPPGRPKLDVLAETSIEAPRVGPGRQDDEFEEYAVQVAVTGRIPDYKLTLSSKPTLPEIDIQYLILLGKTKQQLADEGFGQSSLELVSADIGSLVSEWIEAPFLDEVRVQPTVGGGGRIEAILRLGRSIRIGLVGRQEGGVTSYDARFRQKIQDNLLLEAIRRGRGEDNRERQRYEVQLKYTIPVD